MLSINVEGKPSLPLLQINLLGILLTKMFKFSEKKKIGTHINKMIIYNCYFYLFLSLSFIK